MVLVEHMGCNTWKYNSGSGVSSSCAVYRLRAAIAVGLANRALELETAAVAVNQIQAVHGASSYEETNLQKTNLKKRI
jgi:hypothetical protein